MVCCVGKRFGRLVVLGESYKNKNIYCLCRCDCGVEKMIRKQHLVNKKIVSCGCYNREISKQRMRCNVIGKKHGLSRIRVYRIWEAMKQRCYNPKTSKYYLYGGRGIIVCNEWLNSFLAFYDWSVANGYSDNLTIDRINTNGNYEPQNCRWITNEEQQNNRRNNHIIMVNGKKMTLAQASRKLNIPQSTIWRYSNKGIFN